eukprot:1143162-Pelagomonas_calceolata.AAC.2
MRRVVEGVATITCRTFLWRVGYRCDNFGSFEGWVGWVLPGDGILEAWVQAVPYTPSLKSQNTFLEAPPVSVCEKGFGVVMLGIQEWSGLLRLKELRGAGWSVVFSIILNDAGKLKYSEGRQGVQQCPVPKDSFDGKRMVMTVAQKSIAIVLMGMEV